MEIESYSNYNNEHYLRQILDSSPFLLKLLLSCLNLEYLPQNFFQLKNLNLFLDELSDRWNQNSKILTSSQNISDSSQIVRLAKCIRKVGCTCIDCVPEEIKQEAASKIPLSPLEFAKSPLKTQMDFIEKSPLKFKEFFDKVLSGDSKTYDESLEEEWFLKALNTLILSEMKEVMIRNLIKSRTIWHLIFLSVGFSDNKRWRALQALIHLAYPPTSPFEEIKNLPYPYPDEPMHKLSDKIHAQRCDVEKWIEPLSEVTFRTNILPLCWEDVLLLKKSGHLAKSDYMNHLNACLSTANGIKMPINWLRNLETTGKLTVSEGHTYRKLLEKLTTILFPESFVKLSTRSPKDSLLLPHRQAKIFLNMLSENIPKSHAQEISEINSMKISNGDEAMDILALSDRVDEDLETLLECEGSKSKKLNENCQMSIIVREWKKIRKWGEFRGFVCKLKLNAVTQYFCDQKFPELIEKKQEISKIITQFYEGEVVKRLEKMGMFHVVVDFGLVFGPNEKIEGIIILELNSFGVRTGSGLFDWDKKEDLWTILNGPFEFRIIDKDDEVKELRSFPSVCRCLA